jgi:hypothetical protein
MSPMPRDTRLGAAGEGNRTRHVGLVGGTVKRTTSDTIRRSPVTEALFGPIQSRARAEDLARLLGVAVVVLAGVEMVFAHWYGPGAIATAVVEAALGCIVWWRRSVVAAVALLAVTLAASVFVLLEVLRVADTVAAWALFLAQAGVWLGGRAVQCVVSRRRLPAP